MAKLRGKKKADFLRRMALGRKRAARKTTSRRKPATTRRKKATTKRRATRRTTARKAPVRRRRAKPEGVLSGLFRNAVPSVVGIVAAGTLARAIPAANTPAKRAMVTAGGALGLAMASKFIARNVPLRVVTPTAIKAVAAGMAVDSVFRGSTELRGKLDRLPEAARRPGGLLAGRRSTPTSSGSGSPFGMAAGVTSHN